MKKQNEKQSVDLADDKGNFIEFIGSKEERMRGLNRIVGAYCKLIRPAIAED